MEQLNFYHLLADFKLEDIFHAYMNCRHNKRRSGSSLLFEKYYEKKLIQLYQEILNRTYHTRSSKAFIVNQPVKREVFAANFRDRIIHHLIIGKTIHLFESVFSDFSYSCRVGKGTLHGIKDCAQMMKICSNGYTSDCYVLRLDIHGFFFHINKKILYSKIHQLITKEYHESNRETLLYLIREVLKDNPTKNCIICGSRQDWQGLPKTKSLFYSGQDKGLPIGNLTSQIFANFYLNDFDHYITGLDNNIFYARYVDDIVIMHPNREYLLQVKQKADDYLTHQLGLTLHPKKISLQHFSKGFAFIGAYIKPGRIYPGKRFRTSFYQKIHHLNKEWEKNNKKLNRDLIQKTLSTLNSYLGFLKHYNSWRVKLKGWNMLNEEIRAIFHTDEDINKIWLDKKIKKQLIDDARRMFTEPMTINKKYRKIMSFRPKKKPDQ